MIDMSCQCELGEAGTRIPSPLPVSPLWDVWECDECHAVNSPLVKYCYGCQKER
jgi:hypothetical protein